MRRRCRQITPELIERLRQDGYDLRPLGQGRLQLAGIKGPYEVYDPDAWYG